MALNLEKTRVAVKYKKKQMAEEVKEVTEEKVEEVKEEKVEVDPYHTPGAFVSYIFACRNVVHMLHLNTKSYAAHKALDTYYDEVVPIIDSIAEVWQGYKGKVITGYMDFPLAEYESYDPVVYLKEVRDYVQEYRFTAFPKDYSPLQNELDNLENLLNSTLYKLEQLK